MPVSLITFTVWRRLKLIAENVLLVCMILYDLLPKASVNDLDSSQNKLTIRSSVPFDMTVQTETLSKI